MNQPKPSSVALCMQKTATVFGPDMRDGSLSDWAHGFSKREKKRSFLKSLKILYVKKMSQRQKGMHHIGKLSAA
ncbi:hypothetical protein P8452_32222 [Trifolium repens]|nr:hypothetical protein P8452_32222 [Trifolium repens]